MEFESPATGDGENRDPLVLKGSFTPDSAAQVYNDYIRRYYREIGMVEDRDLTVEEAKNEIKTSELPDLQTGIPALALSTNNVNVTIWIDEKTHAPIKLEINKTEVVQALQSEETIIKAVTVYELSEESPVNIPVPKGIES